MEFLDEKEEKFLEEQEEYPEAHRIIYHNRIQKSVDDMARTLMKILEKDPTFFKVEVEKLRDFLNGVSGRR